LFEASVASAQQGPVPPWQGPPAQDEQLAVARSLLMMAESALQPPVWTWCLVARPARLERAAERVCAWAASCAETAPTQARATGTSSRVAEVRSLWE
jgi:hypothetical protein